jgi:hypothetical protein
MRSQLSHSTPIKIGGRTKPIVSEDYIVGLTDGEGCFYVLVRPPFSKKGGGKVQLNFFIKVQEQDKAMLQKVKKSLGCGFLYHQREHRSNHAQCWRYTVSSHKDIFGIIIPLFQRNQLQGIIKRRNFKLFCKIAELVKQGRHHTAKGINRITTLKLQMNHGARVVRESRTLRSDVKSGSRSS